MTINFLGTVNNLITGKDLAAMCDLYSPSIQIQPVQGDVTWLHYKDDSVGDIYISKDVIRYNTDWNGLNDKLTKHKTLTINNVEYVNKFITGGNVDPATEGGGDWDKYIVNIPSTHSLINCQLSTVCKDTIYTNENYNVLRGNSKDIAYYSSISKSTSTNIAGWRPVLIIKNNIPSLIVESSNLGKVSECPNIKFNIVDIDTDDVFEINIKLDDIVIDTRTNELQGEKNIDFSSHWDSLKYSKHKIEIIISDGANTVSTIIEFTKTCATSFPLLEDATLLQILEQIKKINIDKQTFKGILSNHLTNKRIETSNTDDLLTLIEKVEDIELYPENIPKWISSGAWIRGVGFPGSTRPSGGCVFDETKLILYLGSRLYIYDTEHNSWEDLKTVPSSGENIYSMCNANGDVYALTGQRKLYKYNKTLTLWEEKITITDLYGAIAYMCYMDNNIYIIELSDNSSKKCICYNIETNTTSIKTPSYLPLISYRGTMLENNAYLLYGESLVIYNTTTDAWSDKKINKISNTVCDQICGYGNYLYVFAYNSDTSSAMRYNILDETVEEIEDKKSDSLKSAVCMYIKGKIYLIGGYNNAIRKDNEFYFI